MKCPICGCEKFYVKNPEDEFETFEFRIDDGRVAHGSETGADVPEVGIATETFCNKCSWHGKLGELKKN
jgi:hypothetical protein